MNLGQLEAQAYRELGYAAAPATDVVSRLRAYLNEAHREILGQKGLGILRRQVLTFASVANSPFAVLPTAAVRVNSVQDRVNLWELSQITLEDIRSRDPGLNLTVSNPDSYAILHFAAPVAKDPSDASELFVKSSSTSDDNTKTAYLEGIITGGYYRTASVALNGVTAVSLGATITTWIAVTKFYIGPSSGSTQVTAAGTITLNEDSGIGTELARIRIGGSYARYTRLHFSPTPSAANTYYADVELHVEDMANLEDEPLLPEDFHRLLLSGVKIRDYTKKERFQQATIERKLWTDGLSDLKLFLAKRKKTSPRRGWSALGPYYPAGS